MTNGTGVGHWPGRQRAARRLGGPLLGSAIASLALVGLAAFPAAGAVLGGTVLGSTALGGGASVGGAAGFVVHQLPGGVTTVNVCSDIVAPNTAECLADLRTDGRLRDARPYPSGFAHPSAALGNNGAYDPSYLQSAYDAPSATKGNGETVAIVDAYDDPNAASDLAAYRSTFGLPACGAGCFSKVNESGGTTYPAANSGWSEEISLDLDMVSAICPNCHILLVEASSNSLSDLGASVNEAVTLGANAVSNSYGGSEYLSEVADSASYYDHPGVAIVASSGDAGYGVEFPAASPYVTAVGGTSLNQLTNTGSRDATETAWSGAGSGCSAYEPKPGYQSDSGCPRRTVTDVSAVADPNTGVWVYDSYASSGSWGVFGGTSVASPIVASFYALAGSPGTTPAADPYGDPAGLNDITSGSNGGCGGTYLCTAGAGYDGPTGLGTPNGIGAFTAGVSSCQSTAPCAPTNLVAKPGNGSVSLSWSAPAGSTVTGYDLYRATSSGGESQATPIAVGGTSYVDSGLSNGITYYYEVAALDGTVVGASSSEVSATPTLLTTPGAPSELVAKRGNGKVSLSWVAPISNGGSPVTGYDLYRATSSGGESQATPIGVGGTSYTDSGLSNGTTYYYEVAAVNSLGVGQDSTEVSVTPATTPGPPRSLVARSGSPSGVALTWSAPSSNGGSPITSYVISRSTRSGRETPVATTTCASSCSYGDTSTTRGTTYYYEVAATNAVGTGGVSNQASARSA